MQLPFHIIGPERRTGGSIGERLQHDHIQHAEDCVLDPMPGQESGQRLP